MRPAFSNSTFLLLIVICLLAFGCKKNRSDAPDDADTSVKTPVDNAPTTGTREQLTRDSIFLYARQVYFWWDDLPDYETFNPRNYTSFDSELFAITRFGINPLTNKSFEFSPNPDGSDSMEPKYSYISDITDPDLQAYIPGKRSSVDLEGNGNDFGLLVQPYGTSSDYSFYVQAVYPGSPAAKKGFKRGDQFNIINGTIVGTNYTAEYDIFYNALFNSNSVTIGGTTSTGGSFSRNLAKASYTSSPIYKDSVYTFGTKKIGYFAYGRFSNENNSVGELDRVFTRFSQEAVTDLIVDLRYNGGGYVSTAEYLINLIAPSSLNGKVMFKEYYNKLMQEDKATILSNQPLLNASGKSQFQNGKLVTYADVDYSVEENTILFDKEGSLNSIKNVVFIVSGSTASSSELVINSLKPYMTVKVVGATTYGKPVGFFPIRIDKYDVYLSMFETQNSNGEGSYYSGFTPDTGNSTSDDDSPNYDFGDLSERSFAVAYNYLTKGTFAASDKSGPTISAQRSQTLSAKAGKPFDNHEFKGMIQEPSRMKLK